jgi:hypothetical protein
LHADATRTAHPELILKENCAGIQEDQVAESSRRRGKAVAAHVRRPTALRVVVVAAVGLLGIGAPLAMPAAAHAQAIVQTGPSAGEDEFGSQFVYWRGATGHHNLYEGWYNVYTGKWSGAINLGMGTLGSEPTVAITDQVFAGPGGNEFNAQYVYWTGTNGNLYMAYWQGSWHGPIEIGDQEPCSQPAATTLYPDGAPEIVIFWQGEQGYCGQDNADGSGLFYTYSYDSVDPIAASDYFPGPTWDSNAGLAGSSPSVTTVYEQEIAGDPYALPDTAAIAWQGQNGKLWTQEWDALNGDTTGAVCYTAAGVIGSVPTVSGNTTAYDDEEWQIGWTGQDGILWDGDNIDGAFGPISSQPSAGEMNSAPSMVQAPSGTQLPYPENQSLHVFYAGSNDDLWQAYYDASNYTWAFQDLGDGPIV